MYLEGPQAQPGSPDGNLANPVRMKETNLGDLVCDALLGTFKARAAPRRAGCAVLRCAVLMSCGRLCLGLPGTPCCCTPVLQLLHTLVCLHLRDTSFAWAFRLQNYTAALGGELKGVPVVCLFNGGGVRASVPVGNITQDSIVSIFPFGNWCAHVVVGERAAGGAAAGVHDLLLWSRHADAAPC